MESLVKLEDVAKRYSNKQVLKNISLTIEAGKIIAIQGSNGVGKSTLLQLIAGIERPSSGKVLYGKPQMKIGFVPERFPKVLRFTPVEYLFYMGRMSGISKEVLQKKITRLIQRFHLDDFANQPIMKLSKGNIQKVGIIQAVLQEPELIILDEPLSGLDVSAQGELVKLIVEMRERGSTILVTYHEDNAFDSIVDKIYYLDQKNIVETKSTQKSFMKLIVVQYLDKAQLQEWTEIERVEEQDEQLHLFVRNDYSDQVLYKVLQLGGSIVTVTILPDANGRTSDVE